jgi:UDP-N-acetylglucosamine 4,6-dehydratase/5-epimerase
MENSFKNKTLLITGGTGSFGNTIAKRFLDSSLKEIRIFSRDEKKQDDMRKKYRNSKLKFYIGDVRDYHSVVNACRDVDFIFHAAALKQVPSCEFYPLEAVKTNIIGTENVLDAAINSGVSKVVCLSTDKAVYPINAMGTSKAMMEKVVVAKARSCESTMICVTRYGNVMASRGSVIPLFARQVEAGIPLSITDPSMTRFMMTLNDAVDLVLFAFENGNSGDIFVQQAPASTVENLAKAVAKFLGKADHPLQIMGTRHGEKVYESLLTREEMFSADEFEGYFRVSADQRSLNYDKYISEGDQNVGDIIDYNSHNTNQLTLDGTIELLKKIDLYTGAEKTE